VNAAAVHGIVNATNEAIPYVPHVTARAEAAVFGDLPFELDGHPVRASLGPALSYVGVRSLPYDQTSAPYVLVDGACKLSWRALDLALSATNLLDAKYRLSEFTFVSDFHTQPTPQLAPQRSFTAGAPRTLLLSLAVRLGS